MLLNKPFARGRLVALVGGVPLLGGSRGTFEGGVVAGHGWTMPLMSLLGHTAQESRAAP